MRAFDSQGIRAEPALTLDDDVQIQDIALDPAFDRTGRAYLAASRTRARGREVTIERHRLLGGGLGESLAVVPGLEDHPASRTMLAVAHDGRLAVAQSGVVLAFTGDGRVPEALASPLLGDGPVQPASVAWDQAGQSVWLTGRNAAGAPTVERLGGSVPARNVMTLPAMLADAVPVAHVGTSGNVGIAGASVEAVMEFDSGKRGRDADASGSVALRAPGARGVESRGLVRGPARDERRRHHGRYRGPCGRT